MDQGRCITLLKTLQPVFTTCKVLGSAPWKIVLRHNQCKYVSLQLQTTKCSLAYTGCLFTLIIAQFFQSLHWKIMYRAAYMSAPLLISHFLHGSLYALSGLILLGLSPRRTMKNVEKLLMNIAEVDEILHISVSIYKKMKFWIKLAIFVCFGVLVSYMVMDGILQKLSDRFLYNDIARNIAFLILIGGDIQFMAFIAVLGQRFYTVNKYIEILIFGKYFHQREILTETKVKQTVWFTRVLNCKENQDKPRIHNENSSSTILKLRTCHQQLIDASELLMATYGPFLLSVMAFHFITELLCIYSFITSHSDNFMLNARVALGWGGLCGISIICVTGCCQWTLNEANKTSKLVNKALLQYSSQANFQDLLLFSTQLLHSNLNLSVCGFLNMDFPMLLAFVGSFATYLVIMVQYDLSIIKN